MDLSFDYQLLVDDHVEALARQLGALVHHANTAFAGDAVAEIAKLAIESGSVDVLEEAVAEGVIDLVERANHRLRQSLLQQLAARHVVTIYGGRGAQIIVSAPPQSSSSEASVQSASSVITFVIGASHAPRRARSWDERARRGCDDVRRS